MSEWRSMADGPPPKDGKYLVYARSADPAAPLHQTAWWHADGGWSLVPVWAKAITHWMPLPAPPAALTACSSPAAG